MDRGTLADARSVWRRFAQPRDARALAQHGPARLRLLVALTALVTVAGAAGMYALEDELPGDGGLAGYATALWWTAMVMTTPGSEYWPKTAEGRVLCFLLALINNRGGAVTCHASQVLDAPSIPGWFGTSSRIAAPVRR